MYSDAPICWRERHDASSDEQSGHLFSYLSPEQRVRSFMQYTFATE